MISPEENVIPTSPVVLWNKLMDLRDPRTANWVTVNDSKYIILTLGLYLYIAKIAGPRYMADRKPYDLRRTIQLYNVFQIIANVYFCSKIFYHAFIRSGYSFTCQGLSYATDYHSVELLNSLYYYLIVRIIDFLDTMFFVLKKKFSHISQLHVIHHTIVVFSGWQFMKYGAGGQVVLGVCINSLVHVIMYSYYLLSSLGPEVQKYLWWKKYLTRMQIFQFFVMIAHTSIPLFVECGYPRVLMMLVIPQVMLILGLFVNFYIQSYIKMARSKGATPVRHAAASRDNSCGRQVAAAADQTSKQDTNQNHIKAQ
ncbi:elongation of very long chain fatty acids protein 7-like [Tropilaelaps mercedesae]|uniref:Elongation of very long chain fatty acids protein n=1 Tax=Tropilaelaps mercedesae TaxID=418985 RepID=A0A1V9XMZ3_9ACAR|nr:elongation of very long chain fatty acids protein 7-like [Tropilaelaps mercedesae]